MPEDQTPVLTERRDGVLLITLNRPEARNAVNGALAEGVAAALDDLDASDDVSVGVLTGAGKGFSSGMDLKAFTTGERPWVGDRGFAGITQRASEKPLIAAIEGFAMAGGFEIVLSCDLVVAARHARVGVPRSSTGSSPPPARSSGCPSASPPRRDRAGAHRRPDRCGARARARARQRGPFPATRSTPRSRWRPRSRERSAGPGGVQEARCPPRGLGRGRGVGEAGWLAGPVFASEDAREGAIAFAEKREAGLEGQVGPTVEGPSTEG